jgi:hypothetical protein
MLATRLANQRLTSTTFQKAAEVVTWLGAVQAQDYTGATWGLALRARGLTAGAIEREFAAGRILRTHVMRPTWHFVAAADIRWLQALTGPRVRALTAYYARQLEIDTRLMTRVRTIVEAALAGRNDLTREELSGRLLSDGRITATGQRLAHIVMELELDAVVCSGPRRGKQFTYALVDERAPKARVLPRDEALAELAARYFRSHGPATTRDFAWWSGLTLKEARAVAATIDDDLVLREPPALERVTGADYLLPNYDEYLIAYRDRGAVIDPDRARNLGIFTNVEFPHHVVLDGRVAGSWRRTIGARAASVAFQFYGSVSKRQRAALTRETARYGRMLGVPCAADA